MDTTILAEAHRFWFGELSGPDDFAEDKAETWFKQSDELDREITDRFGPHLDAVAEAELDLADLSREEQVGLVILFDQFTRNMFRKDGRAFAYDADARAVAHALIAMGRERFLPVERGFLYMPFMHSEEIADQDYCVWLIADELMEAQESRVEGLRRNLDFAFYHRDLIRKFGRFPHRNEDLGRESTEDEAKHLAEKGRGY